MMQLKSRTLVDAMREDDIPEVQAIEREIFPTPWPRNAYYRELHHNRSAYYLVLRRDEEIVGYAGLWKMSDEAHVTTVGVRANQQGKGYGHALMAALIQRAYQLGSRWLTLEVRPSNEVAVRLYEKFGFKVIGRRRGYYTDNNEDAIVMWSDSIQAPSFKTRFKDILQTLEIEGLDSSSLQ
ncbi:MAG TPA: ribosomal protein S18-alanine N-acetyltransferase [Candidatus Dormibacteraeota bacterium]|nr:ribosomal protein S18-alanine N-acetyltransferase [Candidatus Dormibacteraeota bacterium]